MCSFLFTNKKVSNLDTVNYYNQRRGPDHTQSLLDEGNLYVHNLLSITGSFTPQPFKDEQIVMVYNGEIYNYKNFGEFSSDGYAIVELYKKKYLNSFVELDGEFAIFIEDKERREFILVTDTFGTKPMYYSIESNNLGVSSYPKTLELLDFKEIERMEPNTILVLDSNTLCVKQKKELYKFNLEQKLDSFEPWVDAFIESVKKRVTTDLDVLVPLSSGYDSGAICTILNHINKDYISFTIKGKENEKILNERLLVNKNSKKEIVNSLNGVKVTEIKDELKKYSQPFFYGPNPKTKTHEGFDDTGSIGLFYILQTSRDKYGVKIVLSGQGSDEIMTNISTYGFQTSNPTKFHENLEEIFPWGNFYMGSQWSYLMKEECVGGSLGYETRYPFLDRKVVQAYLNLKPELKNQNYKSPLTYLLQKFNYPFKFEKIGFQIS